MRLMIAALAVLAGLGLTAPRAQAQYYGCSPALQRPLGHAPDACGPGFYVFCPDGSYIGPNYYLRPPFPPFNGILPGVNGPCAGNGIATFPPHPWAHSPRDYFMWGEAQMERHTRERPLFFR